MQLLQRARANAEQVLHELESERAGQTARYLDAHREVATLEHLKNEMLAAYAQQVSRREQNLIDSLHLARMIRERLSTASQEESSSDSH
jgi:flagellar biosynthesis chaperone FliJ